MRLPRLHASLFRKSCKTNFRQAVSRSERRVPQVPRRAFCGANLGEQDTATLKPLLFLPWPVKARAGVVPKQTLRHLAAGGVAGTENQHSLSIVHRFPRSVT